MATQKKVSLQKRFFYFFIHDFVTFSTYEKRTQSSKLVSNPYFFAENINKIAKVDLEISQNLQKVLPTYCQNSTNFSRLT